MANHVKSREIEERLRKSSLRIGPNATRRVSKALIEAAGIGGGFREDELHDALEALRHEHGMSHGDVEEIRSVLMDEDDEE